MSLSQRCLRLSAILLLAAAGSMMLSGCLKASPGGKSGLVAAIKSTNPLAYYRLKAPSGSSEVGSSSYQSMGGVSSSGSGVVLNGKDGWISTTQAGGIADAGSMMAWVNLAALPSDVGHFFYVEGESQVGNDFDVQFENDNGLRFYTASGAHSSYMPDPKSLVNQWHMIVVTMDAGSRNRAIYWDGQQVATDQDSITPNKTAPFSIGASTVFGGRFFGGSIDQVALWNRALNASEIAAIYQSSK